MDLVNSLSHLENASLVRRLDEPDLAYLFKHTLTQETTYDSLLKTRRADLHRQVAEAIEELFSDQVEQNAAVLQRHFEQAGLNDKAFAYAVMAGDVARRAYAHQEALMYYDRALALGESLDDPQLLSQVRSVYAHRGNVFEVRNDFDKAFENYRNMIADARKTGDLPMEAQGLTLLLSARAAIGDIPDSEQQFEEAIALARRSGDPELIGRALWTLGLALRFKEPRRAIDYLQQALDLARNADLRELAAYALTDLVIAKQFAGRWDSLLEDTERTLEEFRALDNKPMVANSLAMLGDIYYGRGEPGRARALAQEGVRISEAIENPWGVGYNASISLQADLDAGLFDRVLAQVGPLQELVDRINIPIFTGMSRITSAGLYLELNQLERAHALATEALDIMTHLNSAAWGFWTGGTLARVFMRQGKFDRAHAILDPLRRSVRAADANIWGLGMITSPILELGLVEGQYEQAMAFADEVLAAVDIESVQTYVAEGLYLRGLIYDRLGDWASAESNLDQARAIAVRAEINRLLWRVDAGLARLYAARGQEDRARAARQRAIDMIHQLASHIGDPALRESFFKRHDIQDILTS